MPLGWGDTCPLFPIILPTSSLPSAFLSHPLGAHILVTLNSWSLDKRYREWEKEKPSQLTVPGEVKDEGGSSSSGEARGQAFRPPRWKSLRGKSHTLCNVPPSIRFLSPVHQLLPSSDTQSFSPETTAGPQLADILLTARGGPDSHPWFLAHITTEEQRLYTRGGQRSTSVLFLSCYPLCGSGFFFNF